MSTIARRTKRVTIWQGDDLDRLEELAEAIGNAADEGLPRMMGDKPAQVVATEAYNAFRDEAERRAVTIRVQALSRRRWNELVGEHPPRDDHEGDQALGVNADTFAEALLREPDSIVEPEAIVPADAREEFIASLSEGQFELVYSSAWLANRRGGESPKAIPLSSLTPSSDETEN